jgi:hypothetical protein
MSISWEHVRYFRREEFDDPAYPGSGDFIDGEALFLLDKMRHETGWPIITHAVAGGAVDIDGRYGHESQSYHLLKMGCKAVDFHFSTDATARTQYDMVELMHWPGIGVYFDWHWKGRRLSIGFHVDKRPMERIQRWRRENGQYIYLLQ